MHRLSGKGNQSKSEIIKNRKQEKKCRKYTSFGVSSLSGGVRDNFHCCMGPFRMIKGGGGGGGGKRGVLTSAIITIPPTEAGGQEGHS